MPGFRILIVDDEKIVCERLSAEMERAGYEVEAFTGSSEALQRISEQYFDLIITDIKMRGPSGMDLMRFVTENYPQTKVIMITGFATVETAKQALKAGAVDFIAKPFKMRELRDLVTRLAGLSRKGGETS